jgi:hypothetical protein
MYCPQIRGIGRPRPVFTCQSSVFSRHSERPRTRCGSRSQSIRYPGEGRGRAGPSGRPPQVAQGSARSRRDAKGIGDGSAAQADPLQLGHDRVSVPRAADRVAGLIGEAGAGCGVRLGLAECCPAADDLFFGPAGANGLPFAFDRHRHGGSAIPIPASVSMAGVRRASAHRSRQR